MKPSHSHTLLFICVAALAACSATTPTPAPQQTPASVQASPVTPAVADTPPTSATSATPSSAPAPAPPIGRFAVELRRADYGIDTTANGRAPLKEGVYEESVAGSNSKNTVRLGPAPAFGDLNGDGVEDAAVSLLAEPGGSGSFTYVSAVLNANGAASPAGSLLIGDRITLQSMRIVDGKIELTWLDRKPGEPMSTTPAKQVSKSFVVQGGKLVQATGAGADS